MPLWTDDWSQKLIQQYQAGRGRLWRRVQGDLLANHLAKCRDRVVKFDQFHTVPYGFRRQGVEHLHSVSPSKFGNQLISYDLLAPRQPTRIIDEFRRRLLEQNQGQGLQRVINQVIHVRRAKGTFHVAAGPAPETGISGLREQGIQGW